jgi:glutaredoxin
VNELTPNEPTPNQPTPNRPVTQREAAAGCGSLAAATVILAAGLIDLFSEGGVPLPGFWFRNRPTFALLMIVLFGVAFWMLRPRGRRVGERQWRASRPGIRFRSVRLYTRPGCHLCEVAWNTLEQYAEYLPEIELVDISDRPELTAAYGLEIPVVECDGVVRFRGIVNEVLVQRLIEGTPPLEDCVA